MALISCAFEIGRVVAEIIQEGKEMLEHSVVVVMSCSMLVIVPSSRFTESAVQRSGSLLNGSVATFVARTKFMGFYLKLSILKSVDTIRERRSSGRAWYGEIDVDKRTTPKGNQCHAPRW